MTLWVYALSRSTISMCLQQIRANLGQGPGRRLDGPQTPPTPIPKDQLRAVTIKSEYKVSSQLLKESYNSLLLLSCRSKAIAIDQLTSPRPKRPEPHPHVSKKKLLRSIGYRKLQEKRTPCSHSKTASRTGLVVSAAFRPGPISWSAAAAACLCAESPLGCPFVSHAGPDCCGADFA